MKLKKIHLRNFRCYERCEIDFENDLTVLIAPNGMGKTAILDAIAYGFGTLYRGFPGVKTNDISLFDIRVEKNETQAQACLLAFLAEHDDKPMFWGRQKRKNSGVRASVLQAMRQEADKMRPLDRRDEKLRPSLLSAQRLNKSILEDYNSERQFDLPLIVYFGTERSVRTEVKRRRGFKNAFTRFDAIVGALDATASFRKALEWFNAMEELERREKIEKKNLRYKRPDLEAVRRVICEMLPPRHENPRIEMRPLRFVIDQRIEGGARKTLRLGQLSDGYRIVLAMVMDLARRMIESNPSKKGLNPLEVPSIVLIDEIDLHLHPEWQQKILIDLQRVFPKTQFIVTTHSPQVLTTVPPRCLRKISFDANGAHVDAEFSFLLGARADYVLEDVLGVSARPEMLSEVQDLQRYKSLVEADSWDTEEALNLRQRLNAWGRGYEVDLEKIDVDIKVREFRRAKKRS